MGKDIDLSNKRFSRLLVIDLNPIRSKDRSKRWNCICDCGNEITVCARDLIKGHTKSCGCLSKDRLIKLNKSRTLPNGISRFNNLYYQYKYNAKKRGYSFELNKEEFSDLINSNCHYCGSEPKNNRKILANDSNGFTYNGIDRVDNSIGYSFNNCVTSCKICNRAKDILTYDEFINWIKTVHNYLNLK